MEIGSKLKNVRTGLNLTQETIAEALGVSRQTVSNWENNRSYPDIISLIKLSDLYSVTLDELVKEDRNMIRHLDDCTNEVKSRRRFSRTLFILIYLIVWFLCLLLFWCGIDGSDAMGFSILVFYIILPILSFTISYLFGNSDSHPLLKVSIPILCGLIHMLTDTLTFRLANALSGGSPTWFHLSWFLVGLIASAIGVGCGSLSHLGTGPHSK